MPPWAALSAWMLALAEYLFVGVKRTSLKDAPRTAFDPSETSGLIACKAALCRFSLAAAAKC
jgi:hypothetical protein